MMYPTEEQKQTEMHGVYRSIENRITRLEKETAGLDNAGNIKATAIADYDLAYAKAMAKLALGTVKEVGGVALDGKAAVTLIPKLAAGMCYDERVALEISTNAYKSISTKISVLSATLNAKQSLFRHLQ